MNSKKLLYVILILPLIITSGCAQILDTDASMQPEPEEHENMISEPTQTPEPMPVPTPTKTPVYTPEESPEPSQMQTHKLSPGFGFIDAHADTISRALSLDQSQQNLYSNDALHVDFSRLAKFDAPVQVFALWLSDAFVSTAFEQTNLMLDFFEQEVKKHSDIIEIALDLDDIRRIAFDGKISAILSIEGGEALMGNLENLDHFYNRGVRILGLTWNRENALGFGQATGSTRGLKPFGIEVVQRMDELGMIVDVSHLNEAGFRDFQNISTRPYMASHSNAYSVLAHNRNLRDDQILAIVESGGIIGFNMFSSFIASMSRVTIDDVMAHFRHFIKIGAGNNIGLGCDFDGIHLTPEGITDVSSLKALREALAEEFDEDTAHRIMEGNFYEFFKRYFETE